MMQRRSGAGRWLVWVLQGVYAACLLGLLLLPAHRYGWMREIDPAFGGPLPEDGSANRMVAAVVLLAVALLAQLGVALMAGRSPARWAALGLAVVVAAVWVLRFGAS